MTFLNPISGTLSAGSILRFEPVLPALGAWSRTFPAKACQCLFRMAHPIANQPRARGT
jgi:hypothetical protein